MTEDLDLAAILPAPMSAESLSQSIAESGYPFQTVAAAALKREGFEVTEEWAYIDAESGQRRCMDLVAERNVSGVPYATQVGQSTLTLSLIAECKRSRAPFVFFESVNPLPANCFPVVTGLGAGFVELLPPPEPSVKGKRPALTSSWHEVPVNQLLRGDETEFVKEPRMIATMSKAASNGKRVTLRGDEAYNDLLLPLTKAATFYRSRFWAYRSAGELHDVRLAVPVAILDAPMVVVGKRKGSKPRPANWLRVVVHSADEETPRWEPLGFEVIDIVHSDFLETYLKSYAVPCAMELWERQVKLHEIVVGGRAFVEGLQKLRPPRTLRDDSLSPGRP